MRPNKLNIFHFFNKSLVGYLFFLHRFFGTMREKKEVLWFFSAFIVFARQNTSVRRNTLLTYSAVCCCCCCCLLLFMLQIDDFGSIFLVFFVSLSHFIHFIWAFSCILLLYIQAEKLFICECTHTARERKKLGEYLLYAKRYLNLRCFFVRFTQSVHKIHSCAAILCLSTECVVLFLHTDGIDVSVLLTTNWLNAVDECTTTIEIHCQFIWYWVVLDVYFHFF